MLLVGLSLSACAGVERGTPVQNGPGTTERRAEPVQPSEPDQARVDDSDVVFLAVADDSRSIPPKDGELVIDGITEVLERFPLVDAEGVQVFDWQGQPVFVLDYVRELWIRNHIRPYCVGDRIAGTRLQVVKIYTDNGRIGADVRELPE